MSEGLLLPTIEHSCTHLLFLFLPVVALPPLLLPPSFCCLQQFFSSTTTNFWQGLLFWLVSILDVLKRRLLFTMVVMGDVE